MNTKYIDLINQSFYFPQEEFKLNEKNLEFHGIDLIGLVEEYGAPLKFTYLPQISNNINRAKRWFDAAIKKHKYKILMGNRLNNLSKSSLHSGHM